MFCQEPNCRNHRSITSNVQSESTSSVSSSSRFDLCKENFYKNKEKNKTNVSEAHFSYIKNNSDRNSKTFSKHKAQQGMENKAKEETSKANTKRPTSFALPFQSIKLSSNTSNNTRLEKRKTVRSTKVDTASTVLAFYGADIDYKGYKKMSSECIVQPRIIVMICAYLGPLAAGLSKGIVYASSDTNQIPNWTEHLYLLGGLTSSVFALSLMLRIVGRVRTSASVTILLLVLTIVQMFTSGDIDENKLSGKSWELSLIEFTTGFAIGIHLPTQQLIVGECISPKYRSSFAVLCYLLFLLGHLLAHALSHYNTVAVPGLCILNVVILSAHLVAVGFLHPESPRYLLSVRDDKESCVESIQWLRGKNADISEEYEDMTDLFMWGNNSVGNSRQGYINDTINRKGACHQFINNVSRFERPIVIPMVISATLMSLSALSGYLSLTQIYLNKFRDYEELWKEKSYEKTVNNADISDMDDDFDSARNVHMDITSLILGIGVATSAACALLVGRVGVKTLLLLSSSLMAASMFFLSLLSHFSQDDWVLQTYTTNEQWSSYEWTVHSAIIIYLVSYHAGVGPLSWMVMIELIPCRAPVEAGIAAVSSCWWAFNLAFSMILIHISGYSAPIGLSGLCAIYAVVACLLYAFVLQAIPSSKNIHNHSLSQIERYFCKKLTPKNGAESGSDDSELGSGDIKVDLRKNDLTSSTSDVEERQSSTST